MIEKLAISIVGYGTMGHIVEQYLDHQRYELISIIDHHHELSHFRAINAESMKNSRVAICFTTSDSVVEMIEQLAKLKIKIVLATTGWLNNIDKVTSIINKYNGSLIYSANFSIGVLLFLELLKKAGNLFNKFDDYHAFGYEIHHRRKIDYPSGTLLTAANILREAMPKQNKLVVEPINRQINKDELYLGSIRGGDVVGYHEFTFDSTFDSISIKHEAKSRSTFASGALFAATWIADKSGIYNEQALINSLMN